MKASLAGDHLPSTSLDRWIYALKPASWPKLFVPTLLGQILGVASIGGLNLAGLGWGFGFTVLGLVFIVLLNDWGDREVDTLKRRMFPDGCSPKTIPDQILGSGVVGLVGAVFGLVALLAAAAAEASLQRPFALEAGLGCMLIFVAYTLPPIRLNYRGGGELLEMLGVGVALPLYNVYLQAGVIIPQAWPWICGFAVLSLGSATASGLADEESDRAGSKRTIASTWGNAPARMLTEACVLLGGGIWCAAAAWQPELAPIWVIVPASAILLWNFAAMRRVSGTAVTNAFEAQAQYKRFLHRAIWHSTTVAAMLLWIRLVLL